MKKSKLVDVVLRGGSWIGVRSDCRSAYRFVDGPGDYLYEIGFRVVCVPKPPAVKGKSP